MNDMNRTAIIGSAAATLMTGMAFAGLELGAPFADHAVLQRGMEVPVWGTATAGSEVTVSFSGEKATGTTGADGKWMVRLPKMAASKEGRELVVTECKPGWLGSTVDTKTVGDVLVGEVWFACGQSNMECPIWHEGNSRYRDGRGAMMTAMTRMPDVRFVKTPRTAMSAKPGKLKAEWLSFEPKSFVAPPESDHWKLLSAVAWYYARELRIALDVPIGIVESSFAGTGIDAWTLGGGLWNSMVAAYAPMAMRGMIWYQGEHDAKAPSLYCGKMHALYDGWAKAFGNPRLKLYFAQLAPFKTSWLGLAQAQMKFAEEEPNAAIAVTADVGNPDDLHPNEKETVARRLALHALKRDYGFDISEDDSPVFRSAEFRDDLAVLKFDHVKTWYVYNRDFTFGVPFELAGADGVWKPARLVDCGEGFLENQKRGFIGTPELHLRSEGVGHPVAVRYMGGERPTGTLYNQASLPLGPFVFLPEGK